MTAHPLDSNATVTEAEAITGLFTEQEKLLRHHAAWNEVQALLNGDLTRHVNGIPGLPNASFEMMVLSSAIDKLWRRARVVYAINPDLVAELADSTAGEMPGEIFRQLPHTNPLVIFPEPIETVLAPGERGQVVGFYVFGTVGPPEDRQRRFCYTDDPEMTSIALMFVTAVLDNNGKRADWDITRCSIHLDKRFNVATAIERTLRNFAKDIFVANTSDAELTRWFQQALPLALNVLLFLCSDQGDQQVVPQRRRVPANTKNRQHRDKPTRVIKVGWRLGPALRDARRAAATARATGTGTGQPPHQRRGHFRAQRYGPANSKTRIRWIRPYTVRQDLIDQLEHRVIPVDRPRPRA